MEVSGRHEYTVLVRRMGEPQSRSGRFGETNKSLQFRQTQPLFYSGISRCCSIQRLSSGHHYKNCKIRYDTAQNRYNTTQNRYNTAQLGIIQRKYV
jgi:hypothetical protein